MVLNGPLSYYDSVCYSGPAKWVSKWRGHGTLESIVGHHGWPTKIFFEILDALDALACPHGPPSIAGLATCYCNTDGNTKLHSSEIQVKY